MWEVTTRHGKIIITRRCPLRSATMQSPAFNNFSKTVPGIYQWYLHWYHSLLQRPSNHHHNKIATQTWLRWPTWIAGGGKLKICWTLIVLHVHQLAIVTSKVIHLPPYLNLPQQLGLENVKLNILLKVIWLTWVHWEQLERNEDAWLVKACNVLAIGKWRSAWLPEYRKVSISLLHTQLTTTSTDKPCHHSLIVSQLNPFSLTSPIQSCFQHMSILLCDSLAPPP